MGKWWGWASGHRWEMMSDEVLEEGLELGWDEVWVSR